MAMPPVFFLTHRSTSGVLAQPNDIDVVSISADQLQDLVAWLYCLGDLCNQPHDIGFRQVAHKNRRLFMHEKLLEQLPVQVGSLRGHVVGNENKHDTNPATRMT